MLISATNLIGCPILSLHVSGTIAHVDEAIIDPNELKIIAFRVSGPMINDDETGDILPVESIREFSRLGMIIDSTDELVKGEDVIKIKRALDINFLILKLKVESKSGAKLGKVSDYIVEPDTWFIQQLVVQRPIIKALLDPELLISRSEIDSVTDTKVIIKDEKPKLKVEATVPANMSSSFVNPFRERKLATENNNKERN